MRFVQSFAVRCTALPLLLLLGSCDRRDAGVTASPAGPLPHSAYVWQREWTDAVRGAVADHARSFEMLAVLGAQVSRAGTVRPRVDWKVLRQSGRRVVAVIRLEKPLIEDPAAAVTAEVRRLAEEAGTAGLTLSGIQVDYDSPQRKLAGYTAWLKPLKQTLHPLPVHITTLASWLPEPDFRGLIDACDGYILQVHSFDPPAPGQRATVCDSGKARAWVTRAAALGRPFLVALPTYRTTAGYDAEGKYLGAVTEGAAPNWPAGTVREEFPAPAGDLASLVAGWAKDRPAGMEGIIWYRLPVATDVRNWRWPALAAVMSGQAPPAKLEVKLTGTTPVDVVLSNSGDLDSWLPPNITLTWNGPAPAAGDALAGWSLTVSDGRAVFSIPPSTAARLLPAGKTAALGWLRFHDPAPPPDQIRIVVDPPAAPAAGHR